MKRNKQGEIPNYAFQKEGEKKISSSDNWRTPTYLYNQLDSEFNFGLDACADSKNHLCDRYYSLDNSALDLLNFWDVSTFANIPYSIPRSFYEKAWWQSSRWQVPVVLLTKVATSENYWVEYVKDAHVRLIHNRLKFLDENNEPHYGATFGSAIVIFSPETYDNPKTEYWDYKEGFKPRKLF